VLVKGRIMISFAVNENSLKKFIEKYSIADPLSLFSDFLDKFSEYLAANNMAGYDANSLKSHPMYYSFIVGFLNSNNLARNTYWKQVANYINYYAVSKGDLGSMKYVFECILGGDDFDVLEYKESLYNPSLHTAIEHNQPQAMMYLLKLGADYMAFDTVALAEQKKATACLPKLNHIERYLVETQAQPEAISLYKTATGNLDAFVFKQLIDIKGNCTVVHITDDYKVIRTEHCNNNDEAMALLN
jgi:hypothetical protein